MSGYTKALILIDHGSTVDDANNILVDISNKLKEHPGFGFDMIEYCHMELAHPTLEEAFAKCVDKGADQIVVHPYFLAPGRHSKTDIPNMVNNLRKQYPDVRCKITEPLGVHDKLLDVILDRINFSNNFS